MRQPGPAENQDEAGCSPSSSPRGEERRTARAARKIKSSARKNERKLHHQSVDFGTSRYGDIGASCAGHGLLQLFKTPSRVGAL